MNHNDNLYALTGTPPRWASVGARRSNAWTVGWAQIIGRYHPSITEDTVGCQVHPRGVVVYGVDGVGGGARPDVAGQCCGRHLGATPPAAIGDPDALLSWIGGLESAVQNGLRAVTPDPGAATMVSAWLRNNGAGHVMRIGDSRAYLLAQGVLTAVTADQTYAFVGESPPEGGSVDDPARMVGTNAMGEPELQDFQIQAGQVSLLCTDGLHRSLPPSQIAAILGATEAPLKTARALCLAAYDAGSDDDISAVVIRRSPESAWRRALNTFSACISF